MTIFARFQNLSFSLKFGLCPSRFFVVVEESNFKMVVRIVDKYQLDHISINLLVVYRESVNLIGYITRRLSADSQQL